MENKNIPQHIAIIPDGNRRWAKEQGKEASFGHYSAVNRNNLDELIKEVKNLGIKYFSLWAFSTENWKRDKKEIDYIFDLILGLVGRFKKIAKETKTKFKLIGRKDRLPANLIKEIEKLENESGDYKEMNVLLCLDYGGRDEIVRAVNKIIADGKKGINENDFENYLDTAGIPNPDLIVRTGKERRTSGFMPFQSTYAELYFSDVYFPDFDVNELKKAIEWFKERKRNFGK